MSAWIWGSVQDAEASGFANAVWMSLYVTIGFM